jgi:hypothetical protein
MQEIREILRNLSEGSNTVQLQLHNVADPDLHQGGKLDPDPHQSEKQDPDPHLSERGKP